jgi:hypothetical protein
MMPGPARPLSFPARVSISPDWVIRARSYRSVDLPEARERLRDTARRRLGLGRALTVPVDALTWQASFTHVPCKDIISRSFLSQPTGPLLPFQVRFY